LTPKVSHLGLVLFGCFERAADVNPVLKYYRRVSENDTHITPGCTAIGPYPSRRLLLAQLVPSTPSILTGPNKVPVPFNNARNHPAGLPLARCFPGGEGRIGWT